ncbi:CopD family protein [Vaginella massiliensis]|uniref:CopD family protein n=1 Tax=Vaginella massiliensis TaxID=1816680 RepID=UPI0008398F01|nr:CopD family protein [Vaginella massiliensis]
MEPYNYYIYKSLHVIFVVSYFAGLFYIVRLMIYHTDAQKLPSPEKEILTKQYTFMEKRLWNIITVPAFVIMVVMGINMLYKSPGLLNAGWMQFKLGFILLLFAYHYWCWKTLREFQQNIFKYTSVRLRMMNEVATIILFAVVFAVIQKSGFERHWPWAIISFFGVGIILMMIVKLVNRNKK